MVWRSGGAGAALGAVGGFLAADEFCLFACTTKSKAGFYAIAIGLLGGIAGGLLGVAVGSRDRDVLAAGRRSRSLRRQAAGSPG